MKPSLISRSFAIIAFLATAPLAPAAIIYSFQTDQSTYNAAPGDMVSVNVYLRESFAAGDSPLLASEGILGAGFIAAEQSVTSNPPQVLASTDITPGTGFDGVSIATASPDASLFESVDFFSPPVKPLSTSNDPYDIFIGRLQFTAGATPGKDGYILTTRSPTSQDFVTGTTGTVLDPLIQPATFQIAVVAPEPAIAWIALLPLLVLSGRTMSRYACEVRPAVAE
ncbi:MAG TPA: hypothetical protein VFE58_17745 [Tepidisphaeraceae bacterium]|nr:hypothetical protein [Tepidisphaeraceae bacterium]